MRSAARPFSRSEPLQKAIALSANPGAPGFIYESEQKTLIKIIADLRLSIANLKIKDTDFSKKGVAGIHLFMIYDC